MTKPKFKGKYRIESTRLPNRDYAANGWYFVTICTKDCFDYFGQVMSGEVKVSEIGEIAQKYWVEITNHFEYTQINAYVIMPNHVHGIVVIDKPTDVETRNFTDVETRNFTDVETRNFTDVETRNFTDVETRNFASLQKPVDESNKFGPLKSGSLQAIIHAYKSAVTRHCRHNNYDHFAWQSRFYEHIIRADGSLDRIREYIINNPAKWEHEKNNSANLWM
ncbi:transposase [Plectonema radiosum NIES-515]|uniref:Transposase n=1 Tax=Plectonema radiosum NIES-515 TaxID=2986073 RepID=A0ABT3B7N8_9CYAN|nr:transposase [Plectonema radiosum]MCV3217354.1 transposase [Plectonema radiosum NIES-515]